MMTIFLSIAATTTVAVQNKNSQPYYKVCYFNLNLDFLAPQ